MDSYIIHGTLTRNLLNILKDGFIDIKPKKKYITMLSVEHPEQIFTQLLYRDMLDEENQYCHWFDSAIILDKQILKDFPFYVCDGVGGFGLSFKEGYNNDRFVIRGKGKLKKMPSLTKLKNFINKQVEIHKSMHQLSYMHSHEIMFGKKIPIKKYCKCIFMTKYTDPEYVKIEKKIKKICDELDIPLKYQTFTIGTNKLLDLIES